METGQTGTYTGMALENKKSASMYTLVGLFIVTDNCYTVIRYSEFRVSE